MGKRLTQAEIDELLDRGALLHASTGKPYTREEWQRATDGLRLLHELDKLQDAADDDE